MEFLEYNDVSAEIKGTMVSFNSTLCFYLDYSARYFNYIFAGSREIENDRPEYSIQE